jgi:DNA mismatch endonuclease (patch repair protein)
MARDKAITEDFERRGWAVLRIWECELKKKNLTALLKKPMSYLIGERGHNG